MKRICLYLTIVLCSIFACNSWSGSNYIKAKRLFTTAWKLKHELLKNKLFKQIVKLSSNSEYGFFAKGWLKQSNYKYNLAIKNYTKAIKLKPNFWQAYIERGKCYNFLRDMNKKYFAIKNFTKAIEIKSPKQAYNLRGVVYQKLKKYKLAIKDFTKTINLGLDKSICYPYVSRADCYFELGKYKLAIKDYTKAIKLVSKYLLTLRVYLYEHRANSFYKIGKYKLAIKDYTNTIKLKPRDWRTFYKRGLCYKKLRKVDSAARDFSTARNLRSMRR